MLPRILASDLLLSAGSSARLPADVVPAELSRSRADILPSTFHAAGAAGEPCLHRDVSAVSIRVGARRCASIAGAERLGSPS